MLFEIRPGLECSKVFDGLHQYLTEVMLADLEGRPSNQSGLPSGLVAAINGNPPTRKVVEVLVKTLRLLNSAQKQELIDTLKLDTSPGEFLTDHSVMPLLLPEKVFAALKALTEHLYERTSSLKKVRSA